MTTSTAYVESPSSSSSSSEYSDFLSLTNNARRRRQHRRRRTRAVKTVDMRMVIRPSSPSNAQVVLDDECHMCEVLCNVDVNYFVPSLRCVWQTMLNDVHNYDESVFCRCFVEYYNVRLLPAVRQYMRDAQPLAVDMVLQHLRDHVYTYRIAREMQSLFEDKLHYYKASRSSSRPEELVRLANAVSQDIRILRPLLPTATPTGLFSTMSGSDRWEFEKLQDDNGPQMVMDIEESPHLQKETQCVQVLVQDVLEKRTR